MDEDLENQERGLHHSGTVSSPVSLNISISEEDPQESLPEVEVEHLEQTQESPTNQPITEQNSETEEVYSIFSLNEKRFVVLLASVAALFSPLSATVYFPALNTLANDLDVSDTLINLTITTYMVSIAVSFF
jgi:hypothetical protein